MKSSPDNSNGTNYVPTLIAKLKGAVDPNEKVAYYFICNTTDDTISPIPNISGMQSTPNPAENGDTVSTYKDSVNCSFTRETAPQNKYAKVVITYKGQSYVDATTLGVNGTSGSNAFPSLSITSPCNVTAANSICKVTNGLVTIGGRATDTDSDIASVISSTGTVGPLGGVPGNRTWSVGVTFTGTDQTITIKATDTNGNETSQEVTLTAQSTGNTGRVPNFGEGSGSF